MDGWIKLHRGVLDHFVSKDKDVFLLWITILLLANHKSVKFPVGNKVVEVRKGQFMTSRKALSERTGLAESKVERVLKMLKKEQQIEQQSFSKYRLISITNYSLYQSTEQQVNSNRTASEQQVNTNKNVKNVKNVKKHTDKPAGLSDPVWLDWKKIRTVKRLPITTTALKKIEREALKANMSLNQAIEKCAEEGWAGFKAEWVKRAESDLTGTESANRRLLS